ncbi:hypothetical protein K435DRAFT_974518 [Dendrothele bispora CBS 962.96]|uniref:F-box domain-containing protein n=1 Tax=Dendrothele bispora (strain CBS 962.96) TaxID=1314807 RepID=A0A4S8KL84_DENBC|nr:hypothetical protein K435DRAFT_974518 [Dendrothele bispora CBS 962.96]
MANLPTEIWLQIFSSSHEFRPSDLCNISRSCKHLSPIARSILYRSINLRSEIGNDSTMYTLRLLARDLHLASLVSKLSLQRFAQSSQSKFPSLINVDVFKNMNNLRNLELTGSVFMGEKESVKDEVIEVLFDQIGVQELKVFTDSSNGLGLSSAQLMQFMGLRSLLWNGFAMDDSVFDSIWTLLSSSSCTLESISLPFPVGSRPIMNHFFDFHFPNLHSLTLGIWHDGGFLPSSFSHFLLAHSSTLTHLDLDSDTDQLILYSSLTPNLSRASLPQLRYLRANIECVRVMMTIEGGPMHFFSTSLTKLVISPGFVDFVRLNAKIMFSQFQISLETDRGGGSGTYTGTGNTEGTFSVLRELNFDLSPWNEVHRSDIIEIMYQLGVLCGSSLEVWLGTLPSRVQFSPKELAGLFGKFRKLRVIHLWKSFQINLFEKNKDDEIVDREKEYVGEFVLELEGSCPKLEEVYIHFGDDLLFDFVVEQGSEYSDVAIRLVRT